MAKTSTTPKRKKPARKPLTAAQKKARRALVRRRKTAEFQRRSAAAKKGWQTRRARALERGGLASISVVFYSENAEKIFARDKHWIDQIFLNLVPGTVLLEDDESNTDKYRHTYVFPDVIEPEPLAALLDTIPHGAIDTDGAEMHIGFTRGDGEYLPATHANTDADAVIAEAIDFLLHSQLEYEPTPMAKARKRVYKNRQLRPKRKKKPSPRTPEQRKRDNELRKIRHKKKKKDARHT